MNYKFLFPDDLNKLFVDKGYFGIYSIDLIKIYNCGNKEQDIILNSEKFNHVDILGLKNFILNIKNKS